MTKASEKPVSYEVGTVKDENGDILVPIPPALLRELNWSQGDEFDISIDNSGRYILSKVEK
jgi:antitoxin component of MazEF toxin-antitoxin module